MKHTSKLAYLLWLPVLVWLSALSIINVVNWDVSIRVPSIWDLHRAQLKSLYLWKTSTSDVANVKLNVNETQLLVSNWLVIWQNTDVGDDAFVFVGWWQNNSISGSHSGIGWWSGNTISSSFSVIWWWKSNSISWDDSQVNAIAWGNLNSTQAGWTVVGGKNNGINGTWVIVWWLNNKINGDGSLALWANSNWGNWTFSWNGPFVYDYAAVIMASGGTLIWTYDPITWVNLVVDGAVKIWTAEIGWAAGEIRMKDGCFCVYNGHRWYTINKWLEEQCDCNGSWCVLAGHEDNPYLPWDTVRMFKEPAGLVCHEVILNCRSDWYFWCLGSECSSNVTLDWSEYYSNCIVYGEPSCGSANGSGIVEAPTVDSELCRIWTLSGEVTSWNNTFTWTCKHNDESIGCSAKRLYECGVGNGDPRWKELVSIWSSRYEYWSTITSWTYTSNQNPWACQWTCQDGSDAEEDANGNIECKSDYECNDPIKYAQMFNNENEWHVDPVRGAEGPGQVRKLYPTEEEARQHTCSYICANGYEFLHAYGNKPDRCALCEDKTRVTGANGELIACQEKIDICKDKTNYTYVSEEDKCKAYGHCILDGYALDKIPENSNIKSLTQVRPIWQDLDWKGYTYGTVVSGNSCKYVCDRGFIPDMTNGNVRCVQAYCTSSPSNTAGNSPYFTGQPDGVIRNPASIRANREYIEVTQEAYGWFQQQYHDTNGCYYSCPISNLCKFYNGCYYANPNYWTCYSSEDEKNRKCVIKSNCSSSSHECKNRELPSLVWYAYYNRLNYTESDLTFTFSTGAWWYRTYCSEWCMKDTMYRTGIINGEEIHVCWKGCDSNQYFDYVHNYQQGWGCRKCKSNLQKPDTGNIILENPASCTGVCEPGETPALKPNWDFDKCIPTVVDVQGCPEWSEYVGSTTSWDLICRSKYDEYFSSYGQCYEWLDLIITNWVYQCGCSDSNAEVQVQDGNYSCVCNDPNAKMQVQDGNHYCVCKEWFTEDEGWVCQKQDEWPTDPQPIDGGNPTDGG